MVELSELKSAVSSEIRVTSENEHPIGDFPISDTETMQFKFQSVYDAQGKSAAHLLSQAANLANVKVTSILDFPCGHGRVMRAFRAGWPDVKLFACDIDRRGVDFCASTFGAIPVYSDVDLSKVELGAQVDVVWIGSLLTHIDCDGWENVFDFAEKNLREGGLVLATYAGAYVAELVRSGDHQFVDRDEAEKALSMFDESGFGFMKYRGREEMYGRTLTSFSWASEFLAGRKLLRPVIHFERGWSGRQTTIGAVKDPLFSDIR